MPPDPNRFAQGLEATTLRDRIDDEELALDVSRARYERAERASNEARTKFKELEEQYQILKALVDDTAAYLSRSKVDYANRQTSLASYRAFFHPIRKTPLDVLGDIFELCYDELTANVALSIEDDQILSRQRQPFRLAAVCRRWRSASLANPRAWAHVELSFDFVRRSDPRSRLNYLDLVVSRARAVPLDVCLTCTHESKHHYPRLVDAVVNALRNCGTIQVSFSNIIYGNTLLPILEAHMPKLYHARVTLSSVSASLIARIRIFPAAPTLKHIYTDHAFHPNSILAFPALETARLRNVVLTDDGDVLETLLASSRCLATLSLDLPLLNYRVPRPALLSAPHVETLRLQVADDCAVARLFSRYQFPSLSALSLYGEPPSARERLLALQALLSSSPVTSLVLSDIGPADFALLLETLPSIVSLSYLRLECTPIAQGHLVAFCNALRADEDASTWPCGSLTHVQFWETCRIADDCTPEPIVALIRDRAAASRRETSDEGLWLFEAFTVDAWAASRSHLQEQVDRVIYEVSE